MTKQTSLRGATARAPLFLALGAVGFLSSPALAADGAEGGQTNVEQREGRDPNDVLVEGERPEIRLETPRATAPLLDTPQTVTVISDQTLRRQNLLTLRDALATVPGITFGAGEGGGGYGDAINLRGYSASNDITQDGVRDGAQYSRTDPFNLQQIEVYNGANSVYGGSGSVGGTINLVSKVPQAEDLTILSAAIGTDDYYRGTVDANWRVSPLVALRLNAMIHRNDYPGRDFERYKRWGIAPAVTFGIGGSTQVTLAYVHQRDDNVPIYGVPYYLNQINNGPLPGADNSDYFGIRNLDEQETDVDRLTLTIRQEITPNVSVRNLTRYQRVRQYSQTSAPQGTFCLASTGLQPIPTGATTTVGAACPAGLNPGFWQPSGPRALVRDQLNELWYNQTDFRVESGQAGGVRNTLVFGASLAWEDYSLENASLNRNAAGVAQPLPIESISNPAGIYTGPVNYFVTGRSEGEQDNQAIYAFDTLELGAHFELNAGLRYEWVNSDFRTILLPTYPPGTTPPTALALLPQINEEQLFSYRFGAVYKPTRNISIYAAYANSRTPGSATVRLGCGTPTAAGAATSCDAEPETARSYEIGVKADVLDRRLQLTAALFRNERSNFRVPSNDPADPVGTQVVDGRSRVDGLALGVTGNITPAWQIFANYTYLDSEVLQSVSDSCLATPRAACANSAALPDPQRGDRLIQTPKHSGSLFTTYRLPFGLQVGYGITYQGSFATHQRNLNQRTQYFADSYVTQRLFASYAFDNGLTLQLNVQNLFNEDYFTNIRNNVNADGRVTGGWAMPGEARSAVLSVFYSF
ncbi:MAG TPA: TonB-dependent receptor [Allosphingosinicella sp.]|nr:TonB-dependent receptor [Allosphingosinicella sp.]